MLTICQQSCAGCRHVVRTHAACSGREVTHFECRHPQVGGLMGCEHCGSFTNFDLWTLKLRTKTLPPRVRCPEHGCGKLQSMPTDADWRIGYLATQERCGLRLEQPFKPPNWCPGFEPAETVLPSTPAQLTPRQKRRNAGQLVLFAD